MMFNALDEVCQPQISTEFSGFADFFARETVVIYHGETKIVPLGVTINLDYIKEMFMSGSIETAKKIYPDAFKKWFDDPSGIFEFELYDGKIVDFNSIPNEEFNPNLVDYYSVSFAAYEYKKFLKSHFIDLKPRSSLRVKGLIISDGAIDLDYPKEIGMIVHNPVTEHTITWWIDRVLELCGVKLSFNKDNNANYTFKKGDKVAQMTLAEHKLELFGIKPSAVKREYGYGSTGEVRV